MTRVPRTEGGEPFLLRLFLTNSSVFVLRESKMCFLKQLELLVSCILASSSSGYCHKTLAHSGSLVMTGNEEQQEGEKPPERKIRIAERGGGRLAQENKIFVLVQQMSLLSPLRFVLTAGYSLDLLGFISFLSHHKVRLPSTLQIYWARGETMSCNFNSL